MPDPAALVLRSDKGTVLHTGDWKFDETPMLGEDTDRERLRQIGDEGVMALIGDLQMRWSMVTRLLKLLPCRA